jgi:hypothetical protein
MANIKAIGGLAIASVKSVNTLAKAGVKTIGGLTAAASVGFVFVNANGANTSGSGTTATVQLTDVLAGSLIVVVVGGYGSGSIDSVSDGTSSLTATNQIVDSNARCRLFFLPASVATGTVTYTVTYSSSNSDRNMHVYQFTHGGTASYGAGTSTSSAGSTSIDSVDFTVAANNVTVFGAQDEMNYTLSSTTISGTATSAVRRNITLKSGYLIQSAGFTGDLKGTYSGSTRYAAAVRGFVDA